LRFQDLFTVNVDQDLKLEADTFKLQPFDIVSVRNSTGYEVQRQVRVEGEVLYPGVYTITSKNERLSDLVKRAGGLTPSAYTEGASLKRPGAKAVNLDDKNAIDTREEEEKKLLNLKRLQEGGSKDISTPETTLKVITSDLVGIDLNRIMKRPGSRYDLLVEEGDILRVPKQLQTVKVTGEVLSPNSIVYSPGRSFRQYLNGAGGFTFDAYKKGTHIKYANGSVQAASRFLFFNNYPKVLPGAEILVPKKAEREPVTVQGWIGIGTAAASLAAIVVSLLR
jgi:protein involved in polysaccharide export with SLBB domain